MRVIFIFFAMFKSAAFAQTSSFFLPETEGRVFVTLQHAGPSSPFGNTLGNSYGSIKIQSSGRATRFTPRVTVSQVPPPAVRGSGILSFIKGATLDPSRDFFRANIDGQTLLIFPSGEAASNAPPAFIIGFRADGAPYKVLEHDHWDVTFVGAGPRGSSQIVGKNTSEGLCDGSLGNGAPSAATYDPYSVFLAAPGMPAIYSLSLSRAYNLKHYVWAGPQASESVAVVTDLPGHPRRFIPRGSQPVCDLVESAAKTSAQSKE